MAPGPYPPYPKDRTIPIIVIVVILVVCIPIVLAGALYLMVSGLVGAPPAPAGPQKPIVVVSLGTSTATSMDILAAAVQPPTGYLSFRVNLGVNYTYGTAASLRPSGFPTDVLVGSAVYTVTWMSPSGSNLVTSGDVFRIGYPSPVPPAGTTATFVLIWTDGSSVTQATFTIESKPTVILISTKITDGVDVLVSISPPTNPGYFRLNLENLSAPAYGTPKAMPTISGSSVTITVGSGIGQTTFSIVWQNPSGTGELTSGDHFVITHTSGAYSAGTQFAFLLLWNDDSTLVSASWQV